ncbi:hypothetical protein MRX96_054624, partial [Rhipicephalus microplus]
MRQCGEANRGEGGLIYIAFRLRRRSERLVGKPALQGRTPSRPSMKEDAATQLAPLPRRSLDPGSHITPTLDRFRARPNRRPSMSGGAQRDAASVAAGVAAGGDAARSWRALHADLRPTGSSADTCAADLKKPSSWEPKPPPLPDADYKVILRIRGGLDCTKLHPCVLRQLVLKAVGLPISSPDQIRVNPTSHTVL